MAENTIRMDTIGKDQKRLDLPAGVYTGIWWYASFPNHYQGDAAGASAGRGKALIDARAGYIANAIRAIKADTTGPRLQKEFFDAATHPTDTKTIALTANDEHHKAVRNRLRTALLSIFPFDARRNFRD